MTEKLKDIEILIAQIKATPMHQRALGEKLALTLHKKLEAQDTAFLAMLEALKKAEFLIGELEPFVFVGELRLTMMNTQREANAAIVQAEAVRK